MKEYKLGEMEQRFADLIWQHEPISSGELVKLCEKELNWKKSTTYTMLKRLCDRGMFQNQKSMVTALMTREDFLAAQGEQFLNRTFGGSLPRFFAAFTRRNRLSEKEISE
ncbi:MAG: BlaI/MecI/CopY family transcriptional regulator, partial [Clostridiales bacterium]|nr:BlaI/MecI/CopY family transcriptional regulator [Clostridiales bacterium]